MNEIIYQHPSRFALNLRPKFLFAVLFIFICSSVLSAQTPEPVERPSEPPPIKRMSEGEQKQLAVVDDVKKRTKLALDLMDARLLKAETAFAGEDFRDMYEQLGGFHALMDNTLEFLDNSNKDRRKVLYNYKRLEIGLRKLSPRIQLLRRDLPIRYDPYLKSLVRYVRDARDKAIEPLYGDSFAEMEDS